MRFKTFQRVTDSECLEHENLERTNLQLLFLPLLSVYKVFENVAQKYDVMNDAMSLGIHRLWKDKLLHAMHPQPGARLLDVAGGTGKAVLGPGFRLTDLRLLLSCDALLL